MENLKQWAREVTPKALIRELLIKFAQCASTEEADELLDILKARDDDEILVAMYFITYAVPQFRFYRAAQLTDPKWDDPPWTPERVTDTLNSISKLDENWEAFRHERIKDNA